jgi:hypothetical protein
VVAAATSRSFWDDLTQSEGDSHALFASSAVTDSRYCNPSLFSFDIQGKGLLNFLIFQKMVFALWGSLELVSWREEMTADVFMA